jgi:hypothetical protein
MLCSMSNVAGRGAFVGDGGARRDLGGVARHLGGDERAPGATCSGAVLVSQTWR